MDIDFISWSSYRNTLTNLIMKRKTKLDTSIVIFGAGKCNDIDLKVIANNFHLVTLVDYNLDAMVNSLGKYGLSQSDPRIKIVCLDFLGIDLKTYDEYQVLLAKGNNHQDILKFIKNLSAKFKSSLPSINIQKHDLGVCVGVHSQLLAIINCLFDEYKINYHDKLNEAITTEIEILNALVAKYFNTNILQCVNNTLCVGFDIMEISERLNTKQYYNTLIKLISKNDLSSLIQISNEASIAGAYHGYINILERIVSKEISSDYTNMMIWDFNLEKSYLMILTTINK
jgi:hypothetical protein